MQTPDNNTKTEEYSDQHYIGHVTAMSATHNIYTRSSISTQTGIKLIKEGVRITPGFYEQLTKHKLLKPIDESITIENGIDLIRIFSDIEKVLVDDPFFEIFKSAISTLQPIITGFSEEELPAQITLKLTVMANQLPDLYQHSLQVVLVCAYFGVKLDFTEQAMKALVCSALLHDIGELHIDASIASRSGVLDKNGFNQLYAHPVIANLILSKFKYYKHGVCRAIMEHHERMDGSGYPKGLQNEQISEAGYILAIAEFFTGLYQKYSESNSANHLRIILSFQNSKFPEKFLKILSGGIASDKSRHSHKQDSLKQESLQTKLFTLGHVLQDWNKMNNYLKTESSRLEERQLAELVNKRLYELHQGILSLGVEIDATKEFIDMLAENADDLLEVQMIAQEIQYQLNALILEVQRRWPNSEFDNSPYHQIKIWIQHIDNTFFS